MERSVTGPGWSAIADSATFDHGLCIHPADMMQSVDLMRILNIGAAVQFRGEIEMQLLVGKTRRCIKTAEIAQLPRLIAGFF